jgi:hypothetical protein
MPPVFAFWRKAINMQFWKKNRGNSRISSLMLFIPYAFQRYTITSAFIVFAVVMAVVNMFTGSSTIQLLKNDERREPVEYYVTLYPPTSDKAQEDLWIDKVTTLLRHNSFECYSWRYRGMAVIDVLTPLDRKSAVRTITALIQKKGLSNGDLKIESGNIARRTDAYDIVFASDKTASPLKRTWSGEVENLLREKGYFASAKYGQYTPAARNVRYPPFREARSIIEAIRKNGLKSPSAFSVYENSPADDVVLSIAGADDAVLLSGFVPLEKYHPEIYRDSSLFAIEIIAPEGTASVVKVTAHPFAGFSVRFPQDFTPQQQSGVTNGIYQVKYSVNDRKAYSAKFEVDERNRVIREHDKESQKVFYSRVE